MSSAKSQPFCLGLIVLSTRFHPSAYMDVSVLSDWLKYWGRDKMAAIEQTTFSNALSWMKMYELWLRFHWILFLRAQLTISFHWSLVPIMAWRRPGDKPLSEAMMVRLTTHKCVTRPQWVNRLRPDQNCYLGCLVSHIGYSNAYFTHVMWRLNRTTLCHSCIYLCICKVT